MTKRSLALCAVLAAAIVALAAVPAYATIIELGATKTPLLAPACPPNTSPQNCAIILTRVTALETIRDGIAYPTTVKKAGRIVAFTVGLSALSASRTTRLNDIKFLDHQYGGTTQLAITVLAPVGAKKLRQWKVAATSTIFHVQPYLGEVVQLPLQTTLPVQRGDVVALDDADVGAGALDRPPHEAVRVPPEPHGQLHPSRGQLAGPADGRGERALLVRLPRYPGRIHRHRGHGACVSEGVRARAAARARPAELAGARVLLAERRRSEPRAAAGSTAAGP